MRVCAVCVMRDACCGAGVQMQALAIGIECGRAREPAVARRVPTDPAESADEPSARCPICASEPIEYPQCASFAEYLMARVQAAHLVPPRVAGGACSPPPQGVLEHPLVPCPLLYSTEQTRYRQPPTAHHPPPTTHRPPPFAHHPPPAAHRLLLTALGPPACAHRPLPTALRPPPLAHRPLPTALGPSPTVHGARLPRTSGGPARAGSAGRCTRRSSGYLA
jgi:hypothetical protein